MKIAFDMRYDSQYEKTNYPLNTKHQNIFKSKRKKENSFKKVDECYWYSTTYLKLK